MDHRQKYPERDELRAKFTRWLETIIQRAKIDYLRKYENHPEIISYEDIPEAELLDLAQCEYGRRLQGCSLLMILRKNG